MKMKQQIYSILLVLLLASCQDNKISINDIITINGRITYYRITYTSEIFVENGELIEKGKEKYIEQYFDENNNVIKEKIGRYVYYIFYEYDNMGNQIGVKYYDKNKILSSRSEFIEGNDGRIISVITYDENDNILGKTKYIYDFNENIIQKVYFDENGKYKYSIIYEYNNGKIYSETRFGFSEIYTYDDNGKLIEKRIYYNGFLLSRSEILEYDNKTRVIKECIEYFGESLEMKYYEYHDN
jgi:YD repeat-containing protein